MRRGAIVLRRRRVETLRRRQLVRSVLRRVRVGRGMVVDGGHVLRWTGRRVRPEGLLRKCQPITQHVAAPTRTEWADGA